MRLSLLLLMVGLTPAWGSFQSGFLTFDKPEDWSCERSQGIFICQSGKESEKRDSVVLVLATLAAEGVSIEGYEQYLNQVRKLEDDTGKPFQSEVRYVRKRNINGHVWVDSLQHNSELPGYWTRYVVTIHETPKAKLEMLVTYVVSDEKYKDMARIFEGMIDSLKPASNLDMNTPSVQGNGTVPASDILGGGKDIAGLSKSLLSERLKKKAPEEEAKPPAFDPITALAILGGVAAIAFVLIRAKKRKSAAKKDTGGGDNLPTQRAG